MDLVELSKKKVNHKRHSFYSIIYVWTEKECTHSTTSLDFFFKF